MRKKNALLLAAVSAFALTMATTTNAAYQCVWSDGVKLCGNELGFAPSVGGDRRDQFSGDHDRDDSGRSRGSDSAGASEGQEGRGDTSPE